MEQVRIINPFTGEAKEESTNTAELVHAVDIAGNYLGLVPKGTEYAIVPSTPNSDKFKWDFKLLAWRYTETLEEVKQQALINIDSVAGSARLRYITDVPGQQAVYIVKLEQANQYLQDNNAQVPYIEAEAQALNVSLAEAAEQIIYKANLWNNIVGPQIEGIRRKNKLAVDAATTIDQVYSIVAINSAELDAFKG